MSVLDLLARLRDRDVQLRADGNRLRLRAPKGALTPELKTELAERKQELLAFLQSDKESAEPPLERRPDPDAPAPLSYPQQRLWFLDQWQPESSAYHVPDVVRLVGRVRVRLLEQAFGEIVRRHEVLRSVFVTRGDEPVQVVGPPPSPSVPVVDLRGLERRRREDQMRELSLREVAHRFELAQGSPVRFTLLRLAEEEHQALLTMHHVVSDDWSTGLLVRELGALYGAFAEGLPSPLEELDLQYADYAAWQRRWLSGETLQREVAWWRRRLEGAPGELALPLDRPRGETDDPRGGHVTFHLSPECFAQVMRRGQQHGATAFMVLLAAFQALLARLTGQSTIVVGVPIAGRNREEIEDLIGFFVNTLVVPTEVTASLTFDELLQRARETSVGAFAHQDLPFEKLVEELRPEQGGGLTPFFQVAFNMQNAPVSELELPGLALSQVEPEGAEEKFDLTVVLRESARGMGIVLRYKRALFDDTTARRLADTYERVLGAALEAPQTTVSELPLLSDAEHHQLTREWNDPHTVTDAPAPVARFAEHARERPEVPALVGSGAPWSYGQLARRARAWAGALDAFGVGAGDRVGFYLERSPEAVALILGIHWLGAAYVPLDPVYPAERVAFVLGDGDLAAMVTTDDLAAKLPEEVREKVLTLGAATGEPRPIQGPPRARPDHLAYVIYTSGSTGRPKGVGVPQKNVARLFAATDADFGFGPDDVWSLFHSLAFDFSVWELWGALAYGGRLLVVPPRDARSPDRFRALLAEHGVTVLNQTPSAFRQLVAADEAAAGEPALALRWVIFGGEALEPESLRPWFDRHGDRRPTLVNMYGITETTVHVTFRPLSRADLESPASRIGAPIRDLTLHVVDGRGRPAPYGVAGELHVGGDGLSWGYLGRPGLTARRFVPDPWAVKAGARLYRSGDLARRRPDGDLEYLGRMDHQVQLRGFRVELGEIETALARHPAVREAVVLTRRDEATGDHVLWAWAVPRPGTELVVTALRDALRRQLPGYMVPSALWIVDEIPLTAHGKVDRKALLERSGAEQRPDLATEYEPPEGDLETFLAGLMTQVMGVERIGRRDDFFELGGTSISGAVLVNRLQKELEDIVQVVAIFDAPSVAELAAYLRREHPEAVERRFPGEAVERRKTELARVTEDDVARFRALVEPLGPPPETAPGKNPPAVFVLAPPRSGTTLLRVMLGGHPQLFSPPELELLSFHTLRDRQEAFDSERDRFWLEGLVRAVMEVEGCDVATAEEILADMTAAGATAQEAYAFLQERLGQNRLLVDKTPSYALDPEILERAEEIFDGAYYLHLLRHPYGMIASFEDAKLDQIFFRTDHGFDRRPLAELIWRVSQENVLTFLDRIPEERRLRLSFEDLVRGPEEQMRRVAAWLGIDFDPAMTRPYEDDRKRMTEGPHEESRMLGDVKFHQHRGIDPAIAERWRKKYDRDFLGAGTWELAEELGYDRDAGAEPKVDRRIEPRVARGETELPLSYAQERLWFLDRLLPDGSVYNIPSAVRLEGLLVPAVLRHAVDEIIRRHAVLRTVFTEAGDRPVQVIRAPSRGVLPVVDLSGLDLDERSRQARRLADAEASRTFDLTRDPMLRLVLLRLGAAEHAALFTLHHVAGDGWSMGVLLREVARLVPSYGEGRPSPLAEPPVQYADYAAWQRQWLESGVLERELAYWKDRLAEAPPLLELPWDRPRPPVQSFRGRKVPVALPVTLAGELRRLTRDRGSTLYRTLLAAFQALLARLSGQDDVLVGSPVAGRDREEIEGLIGFFVNTLVLRTDVSGDPSFDELVERVDRRVVEAFGRQNVPFERLVDELRVERNLSAAPLFQVMLTLQNTPLEPVELPGLRLEPWGAEASTAKFDLLLSLGEDDGDGSLEGIFEYAVDLFDDTTVTRFAAAFRRLLEGMVEDPRRPVAGVSLLSPAEAHQLRVEVNDTSIVPAVAPRAPEARFSERAAEVPDAVAVVHGDLHLSFGELARRSGELAEALRSRGVGPDVPVGLRLQRGPEQILALLAVWQAGGAYLPLDPAHPEARIRSTVDDAGCPVVWTRDDIHRGGRTAASETPPAPVDSLAYVIYTSGSTGVPKGVGVARRQVSFLVESLERSVYRDAPWGSGGARLRISVHAPWTFDASVKQIVQLLQGRTLVLEDEETRLDALRLVEHLERHGVDVFDVTPSQLETLLDAGLGHRGAPRRVLVGGEAVGPALWERLASHPATRFVNVYGPTETTVDATAEPMEPERPRPSLGPPLPDVRAYVLDRRGRPAPLGVTGELTLGGAGVSRGYLGRPAQTAHRFVPDPFGAFGDRLYRTGDLARWGRDGRVSYLGRGDHQVKVRGFRIELEEVDAAVARLPGVREAAVVAPGEGGARRLVAYVVGQGLEVADLRRELAERLPEYMVPAVWTVLDALPRTSSDKVDRRALAQRPLDAADLQVGEHVAPRNPLEELVGGIWEEVLEIDGVGVEDDFFDLGGHSLLATRVVSRMRRALDVELPLRVLFETPTVAALARWAGEARRTPTASAVPELEALDEARRRAGVALSFSQQRLWFLDRMRPGDPSYHMPNAVPLGAGGDRRRTVRLGQVLSEIVRRHETLRTTFEERDHEPFQVVHPPKPLGLPMADLSGLEPEDARREARGLARAEALRRFDLETGPLARFRLLGVPGKQEGREWLLATLHHVVSDAWSNALLVREVAGLREAYGAGRPSPLEELPVQYGDFAAWQRDWLSGETLEAELAWWRERLAGAPAVLEMPTDRPRPPVRSSRGGVVPVHVPAGISEALRRWARQEGATPFIALLTAFQALLGRWSRQDDVVVGSPVAGRSRPEIEGLIGFFVNTLALRHRVPATAGFRELLAGSRRRVLETFEHQEVPFERLVEDLVEERSTRHTPLFQVLFALQNAPGVGDAAGIVASGDSGDGAEDDLSADVGSAKFDLTLVLGEDEEDSGFEGVLEYSAELFDRTTVVRLRDRLVRLLEWLVEHPEIPLGRADLLPAAERHQLLREFNDETTAYPSERTLAELFAEQAAARPHAPAMVFGDEHLSYGELDRRSARVAAVLAAWGVGVETRVAVALERSRAWGVALLGVVRAGGVYVPLDTAYPEERWAYMLDDADVDVVLTSAELQGVLERVAAQLPRPVRIVDVDDLEPTEEATGVLPPGGHPDQAVYVIYTSGSTGRPKGVVVPHRAVVRLVRDTQYVHLRPGDRVAQISNASFDAATYELWGALLNGGCLVGIPQPAILDPPALVAALEKTGVESMFVTTALFNQVARQVPEGFSSVREVMFGGEASDPRAVARVLETAPPRRLLHVYGPTESTTFATWHPVEAVAPDAVTVPIGGPVANTAVWVADEAGEPVPRGAVGELWIGGDGLARGYGGRPGRTAVSFVPDPRGVEAGARAYRTGDLVRRRSDGAIDFVGRIDHQVKIRGFRIEPGEVEAVLAEHPEVAEAMVLVLGEGSERRLVAYVTGAAEAGQLRAFSTERLPAYMVPAGFVVLDRFPVTPNGKVDRKALAALEPVSAAVEGDMEAPRDAVEEILAGIFAEVLGRETVGRDADFFELGGHSLLATQVMSRLRGALDVDLPLAVLFETATVAELAARVRRDRQPGAEGLVLEPLAAAERRVGVPLSFAQQRLWFLDRLDPGSVAYLIPEALRISGTLRPVAWRHVFTEVVRRHETLRTVFREIDEEPRQVVRSPRPVTVPLVDLSALSREAREHEARRGAAAEAHRPMDLETGPPARFRWLRLDTQDHALLVTQHHVVSDGWSTGILLRESGTLLDAYAAGRPSPLPELALQYGDFAVWQRRWLQGQVLERQLAYWRHELAGSPGLLELPTDRPRPPVQTFEGRQYPVSLPGSVSESLEALARREGATLYMLLLAAFQALLGRWSGQDDVSVGSPIAGRNRRELEDLIGFFVNTLVLRTDLAGEPDFRELLGRVRRTALAAYAHQDVPFERLVEELGVERNLSTTPLFQVMLVLQNAPTTEALDLPEGDLEPLQVEGTAAKFELLLALAETDEGLRGTLAYNVDLFDHTTVVRWMGHFRKLLTAVAADPERPLAEIPWGTAAERQQVWVEWNDTGRPRSDATLAGLVRAQAERTPEAEALVVGSERWTFGELLQSSHRLARHLRSLGVGPEARVGVGLARDAHLVVAILAVLEAGGAYVPLDPAYPAERLAFIAEDAGIRWLVTRSDALPELSHQPLQIVDLERDAKLLEAQDPTAPEPWAGPSNLAYLIYTSGSTGRPKGVAIEHASAVELLRWARGVFSAEDLSGMLAATSVNFDLSVFELFLPLAWGGRVILAPDALALPDLPARAEVRWINTVPSAMSELVRMEAVPPSVATVSLAGEPLKRSLVDGVYAAGPVRAVYNLYGPSEDTTYSTGLRVGRGPDEPTIGRPVGATRAWVLGPDGRARGLDAVGELCLSGAGLARGYLGRPARTAQAFVPCPFDGTPGARMYRTGDLARWRAGGELEFLGRLDHQVKVRGFRIEPGEIETALVRHEEVREAAVLARGEGAERRLVAFFEGTAEPAELRLFLAEGLPDHMVPAVFVPLEALPLTPNGKIDRKALAARDLGPATAEAEGTGRAAPVGPTEEIVAGIFAEILGLDDEVAVGRHRSFFELGGHSLLATRVVSRLRTVFDVELPLQRLFEGPTVAEVAAAVEAAARGLSVPPLEALPEADRLRGVPLSFAQRRLWFLHRLEPDSAAYNIPVAVRLPRGIPADGLAQALAEIVHRHESLRTAFRERDGEPVQKVLPVSEASARLVRVDLSRVEPGDRETEAHRLAAAEGRRPFDLAAGRVVRFRGLWSSSAPPILLAAFHHIVSDGWSLGVFFRELATVAAAFARGVPTGLPELAVQIGDVAVWQRSWLTGERLEAEIEYWRDRLQGAPPVLELPTDRPRPAAMSYRGKTLPVTLEPELAEGLRGLARTGGATLFMALAAGFSAFLGRVGGQRDVVLGTPVAGRTHQALEDLIGFFVNTLVLRTDLAGGPGFTDVLARVRRTALAAYEHQHVPFERLVEALDVERDLSTPPVFQVLLALQNAPGAAAGGSMSSEEPDVEPLEVESTTAKYDLLLALAEDDDAGGLQGSFEYATDLFDATTVERWSRGFIALLTAAVEEPERPVEDLPWLAAAQRHQLVVEWNEAALVAPHPTIPQLFAARVAEAPEAPALLFADGAWSYGELDAVSSALTRRLRDLGVGRGTPVAVAMERSPELVATLLAVLRAGGLFVPLDPDYPEERLAFLLDDSRAHVLVSDSPTLERLPAVDLPILQVGGADGLDRSLAAPEPVSQPEDLAYVMYTSGSTGRPKGVAVPHRAVARLVMEANFADLSAERTFLHLAPASFDASTLEIWAPLLRGGKLAIQPPGPIDPASLGETLRRFEVDTLWLTAALFHEVVDVDPEILQPLRQLLAGGDVLSPDHCRRVLTTVEGLTLINGYGPTENTTFTCCWPMASPEAVPSPVPVGRPIGGTWVRIVDPRLRPTPLGVAGELVTGGFGLARGYWRRPALTAERFLPDPESPEGGERLYRTGDRARWRSDGTVEFLGRLDTQVKIRGFRIEPGEIENVLTSHPAIRDTVVLPLGEGISQRLVAFSVPDDSAAGEPDQAALRAYLTDRLPDYMVPGAFVFLEGFPRTPNDKVDRRALAALEPSRARDEVHRPPESPTEEILAGIWADVLGVDAVGVDQDFFELGGHSLLATRVVARIRDAFGIELPLQRIFEAPTVGELAGHLERRVEDRAGSALRALPEARRRNGIRAAPLQEVLWRWERQRTDPARLLPSALRIHGSMGSTLVGQGLGEVLRRHEVLRARFEERSEGLVLRPGPVSAHPAQLVDLRGLEPGDLEKTLAGLVEANAAHPFSSWHPHVRATWVVTGSSDRALLLALHRLVADGPSMDRLQEEIAVLLGDFAAGRPSSLPELELQYADFAVWRRDGLDAGRGEEQLDFWRRWLAGAPTWLPLPEDRPRTGERTGLADVEGLRLEPELSRSLAEAARREGATTDMAMLGVFAALLGRISGLGQVIVGALSAGRDRSETEGLIGPFANTLPIPVELAGAPSFRELTRRVRDVTLAAYAHQDVPFEVLADELAAKPPVPAQPLVQVVFNLKNVDDPDMSLGGLDVTPLEPERSRLEPELVFGGRETATGVQGGLQYVVDRFDAATIRDLLDRFVQLLDAAVAAPERPLQEISLLTPEEGRQLREAADSAPDMEAPRLERWCAASPEAAGPSMPVRRPMLVPLRAEGPEPPWFFLHPAHGDVLCYAEIVRRLPADCGAYGLQRPDVGDVTSMSVEDLAELYAGVVRRVRPEGPCRLAGWSAGAVLAAETAQRLEAAGCPVEALSLIDPPSPDRLSSAAPTELDLLNLFLRELSDQMPEAGLAPVPSLPAGGLRAVWARLAEALPPDLGQAHLQEKYRMFRANVLALVGHEVRLGDAPVLLLLAEDGDRQQERAAAWRSRAVGELEILQVPGTHESMLRHPAVDTLVKQWMAWRRGAVTA